MQKIILVACMIFLITGVVHGTQYSGTVTGHVVSALNINDNVNGVLVTNDRTSVIAEVHDGTFSITLPIGDAMLGFTDQSGAFAKARLPVNVPINATIECNVAMVPMDSNPPDQIVITPINPVVVTQELKPFKGHCYTGNGVLVNMNPVWSLLDGPETDSLDWATGILAPKQPGRYSIMASVGSVRATQRINVTDGPRPKVLYVGLEDRVEDFLKDMGYDVQRSNRIWSSHYGSEGTNIFSGYSVVILDNEQALDPGMNPAIRSYLSNGGGLVLGKSAPLVLAGHKDPTAYMGENLNSIGDWFGFTFTDNSAVGHNNILVHIPKPFGLP